MSKGRSGHGGSRLNNVELAMRLIKELKATIESYVEPRGQLQQEMLDRIATSLQQIEAIDFAGQVASLEQALAEGKTQLEQSIVEGKAALHEQYMEEIRLSNKIKAAHIYMTVEDLKARHEATAQDLATVEAALAGVEATLAEKETTLAKLKDAEVMLADRESKLRNVEGKLAAHRAAVAAL
jgi:hypothetical protein